MIIELYYNKILFMQMYKKVELNRLGILIIIYFLYIL